jgi:hypothetical protein
MTITVRLQHGETISQALIRAQLMSPPGDAPRETITIPPGVYVVGSDIKRTRIVERRTSGIPFLNY